MKLYIVQFYDPTGMQFTHPYELDVLTEDSYIDWIEYADNYKMSNYQLIKMVELENAEIDLIHDTIKARIERYSKTK